MSKLKRTVLKKQDLRGAIQNLIYNETLLLQMKQKILESFIVLNLNMMNKKKARIKYGNL